MEDKSTIIIFIDDEPKPIASFISPVHFELDTRKLVDGNHTLKITISDLKNKASKGHACRIVNFLVNK